MITFIIVLKGFLMAIHFGYCKASLRQSPSFQIFLVSFITKTALPIKTPAKPGLYIQWILARLLVMFNFTDVQKVKAVWWDEEIFTYRPFDWKKSLCLSPRLFCEEVS